MILASQSPRRRELLEAVGFELTVAPADIDEHRLPGEKPVELVARLAREKAEASRAAWAASGASVPADQLLVAADTIVWTADDVLGKPADAADARRMLAELSGQTHHVTTGVCLMLLDGACATERTASFTETTDVEFWPLVGDEIEAYVATGEPLDKAGSYGIQGEGRLLVRRITGDYSNVVGLPVARLVRELATLTDNPSLLARLMKGRHA